MFGDEEKEKNAGNAEEDERRKFQIAYSAAKKLEETVKDPVIMEFIETLKEYCSHELNRDSCSGLFLCDTGAKSREITQDLNAVAIGRYGTEKVEIASYGQELHSFTSSALEGRFGKKCVFVVGSPDCISTKEEIASFMKRITKQCAEKGKERVPTNVLYIQPTEGGDFIKMLLFPSENIDADSVYKRPPKYMRTTSGRE